MEQPSIRQYVAVAVADCNNATLAAIVATGSRLRGRDEVTGELLFGPDGTLRAQVPPEPWDVQPEPQPAKGGKP